MMTTLTVKYELIPLDCNVIGWRGTLSASAGDFGYYEITALGLDPSVISALPRSFHFLHFIFIFIPFKSSDELKLLVIRRRGL
jgi:hypothetical protein